MVKRAKAVSSSYLPVLDNAAITEDNLKLHARHLRKANIVNAIQNEPIPLDARINESDKQSLHNLIMACQFHNCSAYCTKFGTQSCKSFFPFKTQDEKLLKFFSDARRNESYRVHLRRNNIRKIRNRSRTQSFRITRHSDVRSSEPQTYRRFVAGYPGPARPLNGMLRKDAETDWDSPTPDQIEAFKTLKRKLVAPPILGLPKTNKPYKIDTDASTYLLGATLLQQQDETKNEWTPIGYWSKKLTGTERK